MKYLELEGKIVIVGEYFGIFMWSIGFWFAINKNRKYLFSSSTNPAAVHKADAPAEGRGSRCTSRAAAPVEGKRPP